MTKKQAKEITSFLLGKLESHYGIDAINDISAEQFQEIETDLYSTFK